ncbi:unnamed protein product [Heligmosomoides polygyrus]|uniref:Small RNA 2'-O-methyltransferase n=1 Tax=Heligmosomoides polygyrus TaxID=6339 RepID=A0A183G0F6_HELPZ|nr:unnamed protein product [Heligmosomoides polygyrus]
MALLGSLGIERVISVDIDEHEIAKGLKLLKFLTSVVLASLFILVEDLRHRWAKVFVVLSKEASALSCASNQQLRIEHIPLEDATRYVHSVLLNVQPQLFIISTPNHEYNEAFGLTNGEFRHADHKFEFTRQEFRNWLYRTLSDFNSTYEYVVKYIGNIQGEMVAKNSLFPLEREKAKQAFILWLEENPLLEDGLVKSGVGEFWRVGMTTLMDNIELPEQLKKNLNKKALVDVLRFQCNGKVICETFNGETYLNIPHSVTKEELINLMCSKN